MLCLNATFGQRNEKSGEIHTNVVHATMGKTKANSHIPMYINGIPMSISKIPIRYVRIGPTITIGHTIVQVTKLRMINHERIKITQHSSGIIFVGESFQ